MDNETQTKFDKMLLVSETQSITQPHLKNLDIFRITARTHDMDLCNYIYRQCDVICTYINEYIPRYGFLMLQIVYVCLFVL